MSGPWNDFNSAQSNTNVIPKGTLDARQLRSSKGSGAAGCPGSGGI